MSRRRAIGVSVAVALLLAFLWLGSAIATSPAVASFDAAVTRVVQGWRSDMLTAMMRVLTFTGGTVFVTAAVVSIVAVRLVRRERMRNALTTAAIVGGGAALSTLAKGQFVRLRPPVAESLVAIPESFSFPSGHTMASLCLAVAVWLWLTRYPSGSRPRAALLLAGGLYALGVAMSRVYLGVHWSSDVVGAWLLGGAWLVAFTTAWSWTSQKIGEPEGGTDVVPVR